MGGVETSGSSESSAPENLTKPADGQERLRTADADADATSHGTAGGCSSLRLNNSCQVGNHNAIHAFFSEPW